ncbi:uncharacterized protein LOC110737615 [Chenopodium quinoa]|uniref:uncharacterized protein LOC110737615 n=1 Tax=Chenopodium quinoa TaxID=63459 RepID=UPI000B78C77B|nr:uncharacterized protein LOC110737615 [Chenopodium quinoa]
MNVVTLWSGRQLEDSPTKEPSKEIIEEVDEGKKVIDSAKVEDESREATPNLLASYVPKVPFPQRLAQAKLEKNAISAIPSYAKFLKYMLSNKKKLEENATVALTAECSAILQNTLPKKFGDPGSYSIPVKLGDIEINRALCDLDASEDVNVPIILGRPFLATAGAITDMKNGKNTFESAQLPLRKPDDALKIVLVGKDDDGDW